MQQRNFTRGESLSSSSPQPAIGADVPTAAAAAAASARARTRRVVLPRPRRCEVLLAPSAGAVSAAVCRMPDRTLEAELSVVITVPDFAALLRPPDTCSDAVSATTHPHMNNSRTAAPRNV